MVARRVYVNFRKDCNCILTAEDAENAEVFRCVGDLCALEPL